MCLNNFRLSTALMVQTFEGFNGLCTRANDMELHLNKEKETAKESSRVGNNMAVTMHFKAASTHTLKQGLLNIDNKIKVAINNPRENHDNSAAQHPPAGSKQRK